MFTRGILIKKVEGKNIVWFQKSNSYLVLEDLIIEIILGIQNKTNTSKIEKWCSLQLSIPLKIAKVFVEDIVQLYNNQTKVLKRENDSEKNELLIPNKYYSSKYYSINEISFFIQFETKVHESLIHPKFAHLELNHAIDYSKNYQIFNHKNNIVFIKNNKLINKWTKEETHLFQGKLFMHILMDIYKNTENEWLGVFHGSAITNGNNSMLFLGDSGNGKSTSLALLNANGFNCLADDFVPIDSNKKIRSYPAAISIKKNSFNTLLPYYPEIKKSAEYHFKKLNKIVRYIAPSEINYNIKSSCKALIFIKYDKKIDLQVSLISKINAFHQMVPDSWLSPLEKNVNLFLDWFLDLPSYKITYSNNKKMIETVSKIFNDEL